MFNKIKIWFSKIRKNLSKKDSLGDSAIYDENLASLIDTDTTNFDGKLSVADYTVQKALDTLDDHIHDDRYYTETELDSTLVGYIPHSLADAANDFLVASADDTFVKKTLAETGAILEGDIVHDNLQSVHQDVTPGATPTFGDIKGETKCVDFAIMNPNSIYDIDTQIPVFVAHAALTITKIEVSCDADPATEIAGDLKQASAFIGLGSAAVINDFDTTDGVRVDTSITTGAVASGQKVYIEFDAQPIAAITYIHFHIEYDFD